MDYEMDNSAAHEDFGYQTRFTLREMVDDFFSEVAKGRAS